MPAHAYAQRFPVDQAISVRDFARYLRINQRATRALLETWISEHAFPGPLPFTDRWDPLAVDEWFARQAGWVAGEQAASPEDAHSEPFLARERSRSEKTALRTNHQKG